MARRSECDSSANHHLLNPWNKDTILFKSCFDWREVAAGTRFNRYNLSAYSRFQKISRSSCVRPTGPVLGMSWQLIVQKQTDHGKYNESYPVYKYTNNIPHQLEIKLSFSLHACQLEKVLKARTTCLVASSCLCSSSICWHVPYVGCAKVIKISTALLLPTCLQGWQQAAKSTPILALEAGSRWSRIRGFELLLHLQKPILSHGIFNAEGRREEALLVEEEEVLIDRLVQPEVIETLETPHFRPLFFGQKECQRKSGQKKWPERSTAGLQHMPSSCPRTACGEPL